MEPTESKGSPRERVRSGETGILRPVPLALRTHSILPSLARSPTGVINQIMGFFFSKLHRPN